MKSLVDFNATIFFAMGGFKERLNKMRKSRLMFYTFSRKVSKIRKRCYVEDFTGGRKEGGGCVLRGTNDMEGVNGI